MSLFPAAYAQEATEAAGGPGLIASILPFVAILAVFYFLLIRPQNKRRKEHQEMLGSVKKGDTVITYGGLIGKVQKVSDTEISVDLGETRVRVLKSMIASVGDPAKTNAAND